MIALFDIGGTSIKYGVADENREGFFLVGSGETDSNAKKIKGQGIEKKVIQLTEKMAGQYAISGISISTAGMVDAAKGRIVYAHENIPEYTGLDWKTDIQTYLHLPCEVENDVNAAALGEYVYGAGAGSRSMLMMTIGTGIGGAIIQDGRILIEYDAISFFEARNKKIYLNTGIKEYGFYDTMEHLEKELGDPFIRCHRSFLVNRGKIEKTVLAKNMLTLKDGYEIPVSRTYRTAMRNLA